MDSAMKKRFSIPILLKRALSTLLLLIIVPFAIIFLCVLPLLLLLRFLYGLFLGYLVMLLWYPKDKHILFVYSNSPNWKDYIETNILPKIENKSIIINWSDRSKPSWRKMPLEVRVFLHWSKVQPYRNWKKWDGHEYNPIAIILSPWWNVKVLRFWKAFVSYKHGNKKPLEDLEVKLNQYT
jgi:hypothetical protein